MPESESNEVSEYLQESEVSQECKEVIATIPMEKGWVASHLNQYQGFWHTTRQLQGVLSCQKHFEALDTDALIVSTPKSGTTWLKAWTYALLHRKQYPINQQNHPLLTKNPHFLVPFLELDLYINIHHHNHYSLPDLTSFPSPRLFSTHLPYVSLPKSIMQSSCKIVYLCRDPKDTFVSLWHFTNQLRPESRENASVNEAFHRFCKGVSLYGPFWTHVLGYWQMSHEHPNKIMFMRFEEMKMKPSIVLKEVATFVGCPFPEQEDGVVDEILKLCSFDNLRNLRVNRNGKLSSGERHNAFFRRGEIGDWKNHLTTEMIRQLNAITEEKLAQHGLRF